MKTLTAAIAILLATAGLNAAERERPAAPEAQQKERAAREQAAKHIQEMEFKIGMLVKEKEFEKAEAVRRELNKLKAQLGMAERPQPGAPAGPQAEIERRLAHVRVAVENLHAAGMHEHAERVKQDAERMMRELHEQAERREREAREHREGPRPGAEPRVEALLDQLHQMHREVQELREMVKRLSERERK